MRNTLISLLSLILLTLALSARAEPQLLDRVVAVVDDDIVMESELIQRAASIREKMRERNTPVPPTDVLLDQVLEQMVIENIELQLAERAGIRISDNDINETIKNIARQNKMSANQFQEALAQEGVSFRELRDQIKREMTITQLRQRRVASRIQVSDKDIENFLNSDLGKTNLAPDYRLGHILIAVPQSASPADKDAAEEKAYRLYEQLRNGADFAETAVTHSSGQNALQGGDLGWRKAAQLPTLFSDTVLEMSKGDVAKPIRSPSGYHIIKVVDVRGGTEHVIEQTEVQHILIKPNEIRSSADARDLISDIRQRIATGKDSFDDMAKTYSDDPGSALDGGKLGWVNPGSMVPEFEQMMKETAQNSVSPVFQTQYGWHILEVTGRRTQDMSEEIRRNRAREMIRRRKFDEELDTWLREVRQNAYVELRLRDNS